MHVGQGYASGVLPNGNEANYFFDTQYLYLSKSHDKPEIVAKNVDVLLPETTHMGDGDFYNGTVYAPIEHWRGCGNPPQAPIYIVTFDGQSLARLNAYDISATQPEASSVAIIPESNEAVVSSFCNADQLYLYDLKDWSFKGTIPMEIKVPLIQGVAYNRGLLYIAADIQKNGQWMGLLYSLRLKDNKMDLLMTPPQIGEWEGIDFHSNQLRWLLNQSKGQYLFSYQPVATNPAP
jgi:hypothetical protein